MGDIMVCKTCGEQMIGDGYTVNLHCPDSNDDFREPDADPLYCEGTTEEQGE